MMGPDKGPRPLFGEGGGVCGEAFLPLFFPTTPVIRNKRQVHDAVDVRLALDFLCLVLSFTPQ